MPANISRYIATEISKSKQLSSKYNISFQASTDGYFRDRETHAGETTYLSFNEGIVSISGIEDQTAGSANDSILAQQFGISVSNNGVDFGNPRYVTVYNSRCQEINYSSDDTTVVILKVTIVKKRGQNISI